ncbi:MAG: BPL-N domain-containing protein [Alphaproteobacteria bacterium]
MKEIRIYDGPGVDYKCFFNTRVALSSIYGGSEYISAEQIKTREWFDYTSMLVIPGGAASPYNEALGSDGMESIREFVEQGGVFLGICAGAYFSAKESEFGGVYKLPYIKKKHLGLYDGKVKGPVFNNLAEKAKIQVLCSDSVIREVFSYGGGFFENAHLLQSITILASYSHINIQGLDAAFAKIEYGQGLAFSSFVHFEYPEVWQSWKAWLKEQIDLEKHVGGLCL